MSITSGTFVEFHGYYKLAIQGRILAIGNENEKIRFAPADTTGFSDENTITGGWNAIEFINTAETNDSSKLIYCTFEYGKAVGDSWTDKVGGAIYSDNFSKLRISHCDITNNYAFLQGGGIFCNNNSSPVIEYCNITNNKSNDYGGGISTEENCAPLIKNNIIAYNISELVGGGIHASTVYNEGPRIINNFICNNISESSNGGGVYESTPYIEITGNVICNNNGGGIMCGHQLAAGQYLNNTICNNSGGGMYLFAYNLNIYNNILRGNSDQWNEEINTGYNLFNLEFNNIEGGYTYGENIDEAPLFVNETPGQGIGYNALDANWDLLESSPNINAGIVYEWFNIPETDIAGNNRIYGNVIEIGAYENQTIVGIENVLNETKVITSPNPATNEITIQTTVQSLGGVLEIYDIKGRKVKTVKITNRETKINISDLPSGTYIHNYILEGRLVESGKIEVNRN